MLLSSFVYLSLLLAFFKFIEKLWWTPIRLQRLMNSQGIKGPSYTFFPNGNTKEMLMRLQMEAKTKPMGLSHNIFPKLEPKIDYYTKLYGKTYIDVNGSGGELVINEPELIKEILNNKEKAYMKPLLGSYFTNIFGKGLALIEGDTWTKRRKLAYPAFHGTTLKGMATSMIESVETLMEKWKCYEGKELEAYEEFRLLTSEIISRTAFGNSYIDGQAIFEKLGKLTILAMINLNKKGLPLVRLVKTEGQKESEKLKNEIHKSIIEMIKKRENKVMNGEEDNYGFDFLGILLEAYHHKGDNYIGLSLDDVIDECKTIYTAGQKTVNSMLAWTVFLLAMHTDWQEEARKEVLDLFGQKNPNADDVSKLNKLSMILNESLRLYPPAMHIPRKVRRQVKLGGKFIIPADIYLNISILALHHDPEIWGEDVHLFKPERFSEGVSKATNNNPTAFCPFGYGPRICVGLGLILIKLFHKLWWSPTRTQYLMNLQGIKGPSYRFIHGNIREILRIKSEAKSRPIGLSHSMLPNVDPHIELWRQIYGKNFLQWHGLQAQLVITQPELIQEVLYNKEGAYQKLNAEGFSKKLIGDIPKGDKWKKVRKLQNYAFHGESLKGMISSMISSVEVMLERWKHNEDKEIEAFEEFRLLSSEVISRSAFGSSYQEGEHIFKMLRRMAFLAIRNVYKVNIPGISKLFKTADEIESDNLDKEIRSCIMLMIRKRKEKVLISGEDGFGNDFLGLLLMAHHAANENLQITVDDVVEQCKKFYFAGQETTNSLLGWTVFLLALHTNWQEEARKEVIKLFGQENPNPDGIAKLKTMTMVINECLRLYSPAIGVARQVEKEASLGSLNLPKNMNIYISILAVHHDPEIWGEDVHQFKPERFSKGVVKAFMNINNAATAAFFPFGLGPQNCVGSNFSITETKIALSMILQRYSFTLSPTYVHSPMLYVTIRPQHGVQIQLHPL